MTRRSIEIEGSNHGAFPIPMASLVGNLLISSAISGMTRGADSEPGLDEQAAALFENIRKVVAVAGGSTDDIAKINFFVKDLDSRDAINREWVQMFPDPDSRPARRVTVEELRGASLVQCELIAYIGTAS